MAEMLTVGMILPPWYSKVTLDRTFWIGCTPFAHVAPRTCGGADVEASVCENAAVAARQITNNRIVRDTTFPPRWRNATEFSRKIGQARMSEGQCDSWIVD